MVKEAINRLNGWNKILAIMIPLSVAGLIGYGKLQDKVDNLEQNKASKEQVARIEENLNTVKDDLKEIKSDIKKLLINKKIR